MTGSNSEKSCQNSISGFKVKFGKAYFEKAKQNPNIYVLFEADFGSAYFAFLPAYSVKCDVKGLERVMDLFIELEGTDEGTNIYIWEINPETFLTPVGKTSYICENGLWIENLFSDLRPQIEAILFNKTSARVY